MREVVEVEFLLVSNVQELGSVQVFSNGGLQQSYIGGILQRPLSGEAIKSRQSATGSLQS